MTTETLYLIGEEARSSDGAGIGRLARVIVDPVARTVTHLVIQPHTGHGSPRLVPAGLVASPTEPLTLACPAGQFGRLEEAVEGWFLPGAEEDYGYHRDSVASWPFYVLGGGRGMGPGTAVAAHSGEPERGRFMIRDKVPDGEVDVHRGDPVHAADGRIGRVRGLAVDPADQRVTHVLLDEGHLWGHKQVAIPVAAVSRIDDDGIHLEITRDDVRDLPPVDVEGLS